LANISRLTLFILGEFQISRKLLVLALPTSGSIPIVTADNNIAVEEDVHLIKGKVATGNLSGGGHQAPPEPGGEGGYHGSRF